MKVDKVDPNVSKVRIAKVDASTLSPKSFFGLLKPNRNFHTTSRMVNLAPLDPSRVHTRAPRALRSVETMSHVPSSAVIPQWRACYCGRARFSTGHAALEFAPSARVECSESWRGGRLTMVSDRAVHFCRRLFLGFPRRRTLLASSASVRPPQRSAAPCRQPALLRRQRPLTAASLCRRTLPHPWTGSR